MAFSLIATSAATAATVATVSPATAAAPAQCVGSIYMTDSAGGVRPVNQNTGAVGAAYYNGANPSGTPNQVGISKDGLISISTTSGPTPNGSIVEFDSAASAAGVSTVTPRPAIAGVTSQVAGAFNPQSQRFYYGGFSGNNLILAAYNPADNTVISPIATINVPNAPGGNGDLAFGADGTLYFVASVAGTTALYRLSDPLPTAGPAQTFTTAVELSRTATSTATNGIAFASNGYLYLGTATTLTRVNPITGTAAPGTTAQPNPLTFSAGSSTDLATCATPNTVEIATNVNERVNPTDQFNVTLTGGSYSGGGVTPFETGTTAGTDTGPQTTAPETAGPGIVLPGETYTVTISPAGTTNAANYNFSYSCVDENGAVVRSGSGTSTTITPTTGTGSAIDCTFTSAPVTGLAFTKTVNPATFDRAGQTLTYSFAVTNNGATALNNVTVTDPKTGLSPIVCAPVAQGATLPAGASTTCTATYTTTQADVTSGNPVTNAASVTGTTPGGTVVTANSSTFSGNFSSALVAVGDTATTTFNNDVVLAGSTNDTAGTSPIAVGTTRFVANNNPSNAVVSNGGLTLTIPNEGVYTVNANGTITFNPTDTFSGPATTVTYTVNDDNGYSSSASLSVLVRNGPSATNDTIPAFLQGDQGVVSPLANDVPSQRADGSAGTFDRNSFVFEQTPNLPAGSNTNGQTLNVAGEGTYSFDAGSGQALFVPLDSFYGPATPVTYAVTDQAGNLVRATISATVTRVQPIAVDDNAGTGLDNTVQVFVLQNDTAGDPTVPLAPQSLVLNGGQTTVTVAGGVFNVQNGSVLFDPNPGFTGTATVNYTVRDANGTPTTATLNVNVGSGAVLSDDLASAAQAQNVTIPVLGNDRPGDAGTPCTGPNTPANCNTGTFQTNTLSFPAGSQPAGTEYLSPTNIRVPDVGTYSANADGTVTFSPTAQFSGLTPAVTYEVTDSFGTTRQATVQIQVRPITPTATDDTVNTVFNQPVIVPGGANDEPGVDDNGTPNDASDDVSPQIVGAATVFPTANQPANAVVSPDGKTLTLDGQGTFELGTDGSMQFTPENGFSGPTDAITYRIEDQFGTRDTGTVVVNVRPGPTALNNSAIIEQNVTITGDVVGNDTPGQLANGDAGSFDLNSLTFNTAGQPANAVISNNGLTLTLPNQGVYDIVGNGNVSFNPDAAFVGAVDTVRYAVTDSLGNTASAALNITVTGVSPVATDDAGETPFRTAVTLPGSTNDQDASATATIVDANTVLVLAGQPADATLSADGKTLTVPTVGVWTVNSDGTVTFTPANSFAGNASAVYEVQDTNGTTDRGDLTVTVRQGPTADNDSGTTDQNVNVTVDVLDGDVPGQLADGTAGAFDTATLIFTPDNQPNNTVYEIGGLSMAVAGQGTYTIDQNVGTVTFDPEPQFRGVTSPVTYTVADNSGNYVTATATFTVNPINPTPVDDAAATPYATPVTLPGSTNDTPGGTTSINDAATVFDQSNLPATSTVSTDGKTLTQTGVGVWAINADGTVTFTPTDGFTGLAEASYIVQDSNGTTAIGDLTVTVRTGPTAQNDTNATAQNVNVTTDVLTNDEPGLNADGTDGDFDTATMVFTATGQPANATLDNTNRVLTVPGQGVYTINADGTIEFNPESAFTGVASAVTYSVADTHSNRITATLTITVAGVNPVATDDEAVTPYDTNVTLPGATNDSGGSAGAPLVVANTVFPATGQDPDAVISNSGKTLVLAGTGEWTINANGTVTFNPEAGFTGAASARYQVEDTNGTTATATLTVTVGTAPAASPDSASTPQNKPVTFSLLANDAPGTNGDGVAGTLDPASVVFRAGSLPANATLSPDNRTVTIPGEGTYTINDVNGEVTFTPVAAFRGTGTTLGYSVTDSFGNTAFSTLTITVGAVNPTAQNDTGRTPHNTPITLNVLANDAAGAGTTLDAGTLRLINGAGDAVNEVVVPGEGTWTVLNGQVRFTPEKTFTGVTKPLTYQIADSNGTTVRADMTVTVLAPGSTSPVRDVTQQGVPVTVNMVKDAVPAEGETIVNSSLCIVPSTLLVDGKAVNGGTTDCVKTFTQSGVGTWTVNADGTITFAPFDSFFGTVVLNYQIGDTGNNVYTSTLTIEVEKKEETTNDDENGNQDDQNNNDDDTDDPDVNENKGDKNCSDFTYQEDAQAWYDAHNDGLDSDNDGVACENLPSKHKDQNDDQNDEFIPNAGGPALGLLALALGLLGGGVVLVRRSRRV